jgi:hypothetical protein
MLSMCYTIFSVCLALAKNTKWRISAPIINKIHFSPVLKSPNHMGLICVKKIRFRLGHARAPVRDMGCYASETYCQFRELS